MLPSAGSSASKEPTVTAADENNDDSQGFDIIEDEHVWFEDGNIMILAGPGAPVPGWEPVKGGDIYGFKCHKSVLAKHSPVFKDMFENQSNIADLILDDAPVVALADDWQDVRDLLRTFYAAHEIPTKLRDPKNLVRVAGLLRLSKKYMIDDLWSKAVQVLRRDYPSTAREWLAAEAASTEIERVACEEYQHGEDLNASFYASEYWPDPVATIKLACELNIPEVLPAAFYDLNRMYYAHYDERDYGCGYYERAITSPDLDHVNLRRFTEGRESLRFWVRRSLVHAERKDEWIHIQHEDRRMLPLTCQTPAPPAPDPPVERPTKRVKFAQPYPVWPCLPRIKAWLHATHEALVADKPLDNTSVLVDPIGFLADVLATFDPDAVEKRYPLPKDICPACRPWLRDKLQEEINGFWRLLPSCFGVSSLIPRAAAS